MRGVQELVGHQSLAMTQRYSHLSPAALDATIRLLENRALRAVGDSWLFGISATGSFMRHENAGGFRMRPARKCLARTAQLLPDAWWPRYLANAFLQRFFGSSNFTAAGSNASGVELSSGPPECRLVLLMVGIGDDLKKLGVTLDTTAILRRTPTFTGNTARVTAVVLGRLEALVHEDVLPVVAEVVRVHHGRGMPVPMVEELREWDVPSRHDRPVLWVVVGGNTDRHHVPLSRIEQPELVEVVVEPAHGVLDGDVQVPKRVLLGHLDAAPDQWIRPREHHQELVHELRPRLACGLSHWNRYVGHSVLRFFGAAPITRQADACR